ncbi:B-box zinc finger protein 20 [Impatiens glandulifera]|uniref:B-box zinc finger protein 20 n=1 Tax=Impatiens glandulifera TaxID=253017 RepID=UPI001FB087C7|nr:B-box zinc finger protein 20 [Impatiens glandulifera]
MKIQCDVCCKEEACLFCPADEAALCETCDYRVHHANKLAGQHNRFSLLHPSFNDAPLCDVCQDRRGFMFCQEDRAILCRECDIPIHKVNEHTQKHNRFLLTGVKLSSFSDPCSPPLPTTPASASITAASGGDERCMSQEGSISTTNQISEYLIETMQPEWQFDEFIDPSCFPNSFCKVC